MVIHYTSATIPISCSSSSGSKCPTCGDQSSLEGVIFTCITCFLHGDDSNLQIFQYGVSKVHFLAQARGGTCTIAPSDPTCDVLHRVYHLYYNNSFGGYNLFKNNCEDFAIYCKTGLLVKNKSTSGQAVSWSAAAEAASTSVIFGILPLGAIAKGVVSSGILTLAAPAAMIPAAVIICVPFGILTLHTAMVIPATYCHHRYLKDIGVRKDGEKVSLKELNTWAQGAKPLTFGI
ncbi:hypothetical protein GIB67_030245 [Kingdonia uniflora]|uniref:LRAT domain-containing protein n=1 Tax=Kingdonia uniflora TaxID=39325 RepID=A0A7J7MNA6_9MAGN|nr:hypothetical protein GIB67_030245 [Kingdonia uniflora]